MVRIDSLRLNASGNRKEILAAPITPINAGRELLGVARSLRPESRRLPSHTPLMIARGSPSNPGAARDKEGHAVGCVRVTRQKGSRHPGWVILLVQSRMEEPGVDTTLKAGVTGRISPIGPISPIGANGRSASHVP